MSDPIIVAEQLSHRYQNGPFEKTALDEVSLTIERGSSAAIIGVTGSGKSTLVQHFNGLLRPNSGRIWVDGVDVGAKGTDLRALRQRVGMLFQYPEAQLFERTVFADVAFGPQRMRLGRHEIRARVMGALETVGLPPDEYAQRSPFELSGGQRRRVALAGVLSMLPTILVLDEPTVGLDADARADFYSYLQRVQREHAVTVVLVSHDMAEVATLAQRIFVLSNGHLVMQGTPQEVFARVEMLHKHGLAAPPLSELLAALRQRGSALAEDVLTVDAAFALLYEMNRVVRGPLT